MHAGRYAAPRSQGACITLAPARITDAAQVFMVAGQDQFGPLRTLSPIPPETTVSRAAVYAAAPDAGLAPRLRRTSVSHRPLRAILSVGVELSGGLSGAESGLMRRRAGDPCPDIRRLRDLVEASGIDLPERLV